MLCLPQAYIFSIFHCFLICLREYIQNMAKACCKDLAGMFVKEQESPLGGCSPGRARANPIIPDRMGDPGSSWAGTSARYSQSGAAGPMAGHRQLNYLSLDHRLVEHRRFCNSCLLHASPQLSMIIVAILNSQRTLFLCCALAHTFLN